MIASKEEIRNLAFTKNFDINAVKDNILELVELEQVKPLLGNTLFVSVKILPANYCDLLALLKPMIAYYLKYYISQGNHTKTGNKGVQIANGSNETPSTAEVGKREALTFAERYKNQVLIYMKDNSLVKPTDEDNIFNGIIIL